MDREHKKHMETVRLLITETIMVIVIIVTAIILTFVAMGYNLDKNGELGQSGLVQLRSFPSGASITIDGDTIIPRTTASRMLSAGDHTIKLTKDGYDSWEKTITSESGRLLKLEYMRLFYQNRIPEVMREFDGELLFFAPTPNRDFAMLIQKNSSKWNYLDLRGDDAVSTEIDLTELLAGLDVKTVTWNENSDKLLVRAERKNETEWLLINAKNTKESVNLSKEFAMNFTEIRFMTDSGDKLIALENGNLRTIEMGGKTVSQVLASTVKKYDFVSENIVYLDAKQQLGFISGTNTTIAKEFEANSLVNVVISDYIGDKYLTITENDKITIYRGDFPNGERGINDMEKVLEKTISFTPSLLEIRGNNELIIARDGKQIAVFDAEARKLHQFELDTEAPFLVDGYMIGEIVDGKLIVMDFDGTNKRTITDANSNALITRNDKWLYYFTFEDNKISLTREKIIE
ncbi:PEGA domain-containing protein [Candidatus Saccharibacteria bacterium]|nr:PEGA domain-containing protein [Candidatus Saccharibacteria bacterium]